jgi:hypothetical protein
MAKKRRKAKGKHRLLVYYQLGQRWRTPPLLIAFLGLVLLAIGWMGDKGIIQGGSAVLLDRLWSGRAFTFLLIAASLFMYVFAVAMSRTGYVHPRPKALRVRAGLMSLDISYQRVKQIRLTSVTNEYPPDELKGRDWALLEPLAGMSCTAVDLTSWPWPGEKALRRLWNKFLFASDEGVGLVFVIEEPMVLNQQIDSYITARQARKQSATRGYVDPIERAARAQRRQGPQ